MKTSATLMLGFALLAAAWAAPHKIEMPVENLVLKNGQKYANGTIQSFDHASGKVVLMADRKITSLQLELLPDELADRIIAMVPDETQDAIRAEKSARKQQEADAARTKAAQEKARAEELSRGAAEGRARAAETAKETKQEQMKAETTRLARTRADRYFRYEFRPGSGATVQIRRDIDLEEPVEVAGWANRYRVQGQIGLEYYDSKGRSFNSTVQRFEVTAQGDNQGRMTVVDFTVK